MLEILMNVGEIISPIFYKILYMSIIGTILGILILILTKLFDSKLSAKWKSLMWILPLLFLMIPIQRIEIKVPNNIPISSTIDKVENIFNSVESVEYKELNKDTYKLTEPQTAQLEEIQNNENTKHYIKEIILNMILPLLWLIVSTMGLLVFITGNISIITKVRKSKKVKDYRIKAIQRNCKRKLKINKNIEIRSQKVNTSPCIYGIMHPKILIPEGFTEKEDEIIENVFMHELSHYKRKDMITNFILIIITSLHWFNPFAYILFKKIRQEMELATDEIALSKMNKDEKKKYGLTLINLLQTYQNEQLATKMLCIIDDNKCMEKRIKMIKLSTKFKKHRISIIIFIITILLCVISPFLLKTTSEINAYSFSDEDKIYEQIEQYLIKLEEENHYLERPQFANDSDNFKVFIDIGKLGIEENGEEKYVYILALIQSYSVQEELVKNESLRAYKFTIKDNTITNYQIPVDGINYDESVKEIFPEYIIKKMQQSEELINRTKLENEANEYYNFNSYSEKKHLIDGEYISSNSTYNEEEINKLVGKWIPFKAEYNGEQISLRSIYGSGIEYGGELILNHNGTYTEFIGIYSEETMNDLQGTYNIYGNGEKALLKSNNGETKVLECLESSNINSNETTIVERLENGTCIYFKMQ